MLKLQRWTRLTIALPLLFGLVSCGGSDNNGPAQVAVPSVAGQTQSAATSALIAAGLKVGTITDATSATVATGSVISENPAAGAKVSPGSDVSLTLSSGPAQVAVPNVVGSSQSAATSSLTSAGLKLGTVSTSSSATVPAGEVISETPAASTNVAVGTAVDLTVSGGSAAPGFAYVSNATASSLSAYAVNSTSGALTPLTGSPISVPGSVQLYEAKIDPSKHFLYVTDDNTAGKVYAFLINAADGSLTAVSGSPYAAGNGSQSLAFDSTGAHLYVANFDDNTISAYAIDASTGALSQLAGSPYTVIGTSPQPSQLARAGNFLYVADSGTNSVQVFAIDAGTGALTQGVSGSPFATQGSPVSLAIDPAGTVLYTANSAQNVSGFTINASTGALAAIAGNPQAILAYEYISIDPQGKFLFVTEANGVAVYPIGSAGALGSAVSGSPFSAGSTPYSVAFDPTGHFAYVGNDGSANVSEFALDQSSGVLTPLSGSPVAAGTNPDFIAID
jgi:6-phosphogluconolactonase (cycloisomerase 2 family)